ADRERAAAAALAGHDREDRRLERGHLPEVAGDRFGLPALLGAEPRIGAGRVDERDDGLAELLGHVHQPQRLAVPLGVRHPEVPGDLLARVAALLMTDDDEPLLLEARETADTRSVVAEEPIAVELDEIVEQELDEVARVGPLGVAGQLRALPGRQARVGPLAQPRQPLLAPGGLLSRLRDATPCV